MLHGTSMSDKWDVILLKLHNMLVYYCLLMGLIYKQEKLEQTKMFESLTGKGMF